MTDKIEKYDLLITRAGELPSAVQKFIENGWQPFGPPSFIDGTGVVWGYQALVKYAIYDT